MELSRGDRKQMAGLMLEYHPGKNSQSPAQQDETLLEQQQRKYTCLNCNQPFSASMGKYNHIRRRPECQKVDQGELSKINAATVAGPLMKQYT